MKKTKEWEPGKRRMAEILAEFRRGELDLKGLYKRAYLEGGLRGLEFGRKILDGRIHGK